MKEEKQSCITHDNNYSIGGKGKSISDEINQLNDTIDALSEHNSDHNK